MRGKGRIDGEAPQLAPRLGEGFASPSREVNREDRTRFSHPGLILTNHVGWLDRPLVNGERYKLSRSSVARSLHLRQLGQLRA
jgi:hypothetical protein